MENPQAAPAVVNPVAGYMNAESRRSLDNATYSSNRVVTVQAPRDTVLKRALFTLIATFDVTYSSGSPTVSEFGPLDRICPQIELIVNGNRVIKSVTPFMLKMHSGLFSSGKSRKAYSTSASAFTTLRASKELFGGNVAYPATTQFFLFNDCAPMSFELPMAYGEGKFDTELDIRDVASADFKFYFADLTNLQRDGVGATVTYANSNVYIETQIIENRGRARPVNGQPMFDYVESSISRNISGQQKGYQIELQTGNYLAGLGILCRDGDTNKTAKENLLTNIALKINGSTAIQGPVSHRALQDDNLGRYGGESPMGWADSAYVALAQERRGFAYMNLIRNGNWNTAINTSRSAMVDTCKLEFDTPSASGTDAGTYTNPIQVTAHTHEIRPFIYSK